MSHPTRRVVFGVVALVLAAVIWQWAGRNDRQDVGDEIVATDPPPAATATTTTTTPVTRTPQPAARASPPLVEQICLPGTYRRHAPQDDPGLDITGHIDAFEQQRAKVAADLAASADPEHLLTAALLSSSTGEAMQSLQRAMDVNPDDALLLRHALLICLDRNAGPACAMLVPQWERRLLALDRHNSEAWLLATIHRLERGEPAAALAALREAGAAAESRLYFPDLVEIVERSLGASGDLPFHQRAFWAFGLAAATMPAYSKLVEECVSRGATDRDWAQACNRYGALAESQGKSSMTIAIGQSLQELALETLGDEQGLAEVTARMQARRATTMSRLEPDPVDTLGEMLITAEPATFDHYLEVFKRDGEPAARDFVLAEAMRRIAEDDRLDCSVPGQ